MRYPELARSLKYYRQTITNIGGGNMRVCKLFTATLVVLLAASLSFAQDQPREVNWDAFSENLVVALKSGHPGLRQSAMQHIIRYGDKLDVSEGVYYIGLIFRFNDDPQVRRLAMVALHTINTDKAISYLCQNMKYEDNPAIKKQCCCIVNNYVAQKAKERVEELVFLPLPATAQN